MSSEYVGAVILEWDGREIECVSVSSDVSTGKRLVKTMNRSGRAKGHAKGVADFKLSVEVAIPTDGSEPDWLTIESGKLTVVPVDGIGKREVFTGCEVESMSSKYQVDGAAMRTLSITALDRKLQ
ncbi:MAG: phage tail protein [Rhodocyclaceae bacterium]|nr:MAG: phage tail protein [Rhodocyclaceae bacterium]